MMGGREVCAEEFRRLVRGRAGVHGARHAVCMEALVARGGAWKLGAPAIWTHVEVDLAEAFTQRPRLRAAHVF